MTRYLMMFVVLLSVCRSDRFLSEEDGRVAESLASEPINPTQDERVCSGDAQADLDEVSCIEYGGPVMAPEGPSEVFVFYEQSGLTDVSVVVCTLRPAERGYHTENCRACYFTQDQIASYLTDCLNASLPPEQIRWDRSGETVPKTLVENAFARMQHLPKVPKMMECYHGTDNWAGYWADIRFSDPTDYPPIQVRRGHGDCAPHHVIQGANIWCECSSFGFEAIVEFLGGVGPSSYMPPGLEGMMHCSCFEEYCYNGPCMW